MGAVHNVMRRPADSAAPQKSEQDVAQRKAEEERIANEDRMKLRGYANKRDLFSVGENGYPRTLGS